MRLEVKRLLLLSQVAFVIAAQDQIPLNNDHDTAVTKHSDSHEPEHATNIHAGQEETPIRQPGADLVDEALTYLRRLPQPERQRREADNFLVRFFKFLVKSIPTGPVTAPSLDHETTITGPLKSAVGLLSQASQHNNSDALNILADLNFFGNYSHPRDLHTAFHYYQQLAHAHGTTSAQYMIGLFHSTGLGNVVPRDQAKALLYYTVAAAQGDARAEMATGFRHYAGIGTSKSCEVAVKYYKRVADKAVEWYKSGPPGGMSWVHEGWRIVDDEGGIYGEGASAYSSGTNAYKPSPNSDANAAISDVIEYLDLMSQKGDSMATLNLGRIYYEGQRGLDRDFALAKKYLLLVTSRYWRKDGRIVENFKKENEKPAHQAAGFLGRMYLRGDGVKQNFERAKFWFDRGIAKSDKLSQFGLGLMLLHGHGVKKNVAKAIDLLRSSANQDYPPAQVHMGQFYLDQGGRDDIRIANNYFELAGRYGNLHANYYLAELTHFGLGREKQCSLALGYYKNVAEKAEPLVSSWSDANAAYESGEYDLAFLEYLMAAEQGYEKAQTNVGYLLDTVRSQLPVSEFFRKRKDKSGLLDNPTLALIYWTRASRQSNIDALVKIGDYYFYGIGTERDISKAVQCYTGASDYSQSAQALFNLGWMHENGIGLTQDFHLAKRYYDLALEINDEAYLPVTLGLLKLRFRSFWNTITNGDIHSIQDEPKKSKDWSLSEWIANFLQDDSALYDQTGDYYDDLYDGGTLGNEDDLLDDGLLESVLIIGITIALLFLLWWRQRMQQARGGQNNNNNNNNNNNVRGQAARQQQGDQIPDGAFPAWAAGGMGL